MNPLKRKKLSSISSMLMSRDTPILRNVLAQASAADSSQQPSLSQPLSRDQRFHSNGTPESYKPDLSRPTLSDIGRIQPRRMEPSEEAHSPYTDRSAEEDSPGRAPASPPAAFAADLRAGASLSSIAPYVPQQKPEWKRYKQYTRADIMSAIECVRNGMSALQASRKFGVPSRTLYDKVKKLGITTSRPMNRGIKRESNGSPGLSSGGGWSRDDLGDAGFLQQALEGRAEHLGGHDALRAMALAAARAAAAGMPGSPPLLPPSPGVLKFVRRASPSPEREQSPDRRNGYEADDDRVEDLSVHRKRDDDPPGVIMPPMNQVSAIIKKEDALREYRDDQSRRSVPVDCAEGD
jgi:hypothetical protein